MMSSWECHLILGMMRNLSNIAIVWGFASWTKRKLIDMAKYKWQQGKPWLFFWLPWLISHHWVAVARAGHWELTGTLLQQRNRIFMHPSFFRLFRHFVHWIDINTFKTSTINILCMFTMISDETQKYFAIRVCYYYRVGRFPPMSKSTKWMHEPSI